jgi:hypothetical protein
MLGSSHFLKTTISSSLCKSFEEPVQFFNKFSYPVWFSKKRNCQVFLHSFPESQFSNLLKVKLKDGERDQCLNHKS